MNDRSFAGVGILMFVLVAASPGFSSDQKTTSVEKRGAEQKPSAGVDPLLLTVKVPVVSSVGDDIPVAVVNSEKITLEDLRNALAEMHQAKEGVKQEDVTQAAKIDFSVLLKRLIDVQLIVQEAVTIGLDETPEIKKEIDTFSKVTLRSLLREEIWKDLTVNEDEVDKLYQASVNEVKISLVSFKTEKDAKKTVGEIKAGKIFDDVAAQAVKDKKALGIEQGSFVKMEELAPSIAELIPTMKPGSISPVRKIEREGKTAFAFFRLEAKRTIENAAAREDARKKVLEDGKITAISKYLRSLYNQGIKTDVKLINSLDYGPKGPGLEKLLEDQRIIVEIQGEEPVTVGQLSEALQDKLYHGAKNLNSQRLARIKQETVEEIVQKKLLHREALKRGIDKTAAYQKMFNEYRRNILFNAFLEKVIVPDIKMNDGDLIAYYREHPDEFQSSELVKIRALAFKKKADAAAVVDKLRKGAEFGWVKTNAEGQLEKNSDKDAEQLLPFEEEQFTIAKALPEDIQKAIADAHAGDFRLYESPQGIYFVFTIQEVIPAKQQPFEEARDRIRPIVFGKKMTIAMDDWTAKLRENSEITIYLTDFKNK